MEKPFQFDLFNKARLEDNEEVIKEAERVAAEQERIKNEENLVAKAMEEAGFISDEEKRKKAKESKKEWLELRNKIFKEDNDKELF